MLNPQQREAAMSPARRLAVMAAPGSGKTRVLTARLQHATQGARWVDPRECLAITFTNKAAGELVERLQAAGVRVRATTFHGWAARSMRAYADRLGMQPDFTIRDEHDRDDMIRAVGHELRLRHRSPERLWREPEVRQRYAAMLRAQNAVDYDGLEAGLLQLVRDQVAGPQLRARHRFVVVDEHQDTNQVQQEILDTLHPDWLTVVGDHAQSIYGFRGAHPDGFSDLSRRPGWATAELSTNYRSTPSIVAAVSRIGADMQPPGLDQVAGRDTPDRPEDVGELVGHNVDDMNEEVAAQVVTYALGGGDLRRCAVLAPTWALLHAAAAVLDEAGLPWRMPRRDAAAVESEEARWLVHALQASMNARDLVALRHLVRWPRTTVSNDRLATARSEALRGGLPLRDALARWSRAASVAVEISDDGASLALSKAATYLDSELAALHLQTRRASLAVALEALQGQLHRHPAWTARELVDWYATRGVTDLDDDDAQAVALFTVHAAKGLEWDHVWLLGAWAGSMPRSPATADESRRLFYVATSRARESITWCRHEGVERSPFARP